MSEPDRAGTGDSGPHAGADDAGADDPGAKPAPPRFQVQNRQRRHPVDAPGLAAFLGRVALDAAPGDPRGATLRIVSDRGMRALNRRFRDRDRPTDVLAFPADPLPEALPPGEAAYLGDLVVSADTAARQAETGGVGLDAEIRTLAVHGFLHLLGYDHERDRGEMARLERLLRLRHGLASRPTSLRFLPAR